MSRACALALGLAACATPGPVVQPPPHPERSVAIDLTEDALLLGELGRFLAAAEGGRFDEARSFLAAPLRDRYSAERLKADFEAEPPAMERLARARRALSTSKATIDGATARVPLDNGRSLRAVREAGGWKIAALEE